MDLGIAIVSWNVRDLLAACLESVLAEVNRSGLAAGAWVVDNASGDGSPDLVRERFPQVHLIQNRDNPGFGAANNQAFRAMGFAAGREPDPESHFRRIGEWGHPYDPGLPFAVFCLNPDTELRPGALRALYDFLRSRPRAGLVGAGLQNPDGSLQHGAFCFPGPTQAALDLFPPPGRLARLLDSPLNGRYPRGLYAGQEPFRVDFVLGAAFMVWGEALAQTGGFDEHFRLYCEEIDWARRLARLGWERWLHPGAEVVHHGGQSTSQIPLDSLLALWQARRQLYDRYHPPLTVRLTGLLVRAAMRRRARRDPAGAQTYQAIAELWRL